MNPTSRQRSTRDRPAKAPLSVDVVVDAALTLLQSEGLQAVTMRKVAAALDTGPSSLYVYVSGREGLIQAMQQRVFATVELETPDPTRWREQLHALLERVRRALVTHPGIATTLMAEAPATDASLQLVENQLGILLAGGIAPQQAAWATDIFATLVTHSAVEPDMRRANSGEPGDASYATFTGLPRDRFPLLTTYATELVTGDAEQRFRVAIDVVIDGLLAGGATRDHGDEI
ncbi:TetR/AcrR family transcriptional regulator [Nocardia pseudobrasiliensis]|uniref:TetR family transcriptional regulator n=1 Tax=Nocardia pseudobrasiliensis TaxID=45979 RepID=A0A370HXP8_9NOCA|nr:TetR/AcrR family transcriptional regulator C-terminal domain-containing protein [Nocardia pseudobrasiliensis]RDI63070.1 TetR family transcriptional regulator [Nocardia pseudobrasiliensis]